MCVVCVQHRVEDQRLGSELDRISQRFRHYNRAEDRRRASEWEEKDEKENKEEKVEEEQKGSEDKEKEGEKKKEEKEREKRGEEREEEEREEERKEEEREEERKEEEEEGRSSDVHPLTDDPPSDRLKDAGDESVETTPSETLRTLSEETDNSEKELVQQ